MLTFEKKALLKGIEKKQSTKSEKQYTILVLEGEDGRTVDFYHDGLFTAELNKFYNFVFQYKVNKGFGSMSILSVK